MTRPKSCARRTRPTYSSSFWATRRAPGVAVAMEFEGRKMKKAMAAADKSRARYALIIGENEVAGGKYGLKNLASGEQESLSLDEIISKLKPKLAENTKGTDVY